jgi:hypothetical protein
MKYDDQVVCGQIADKEEPHKFSDWGVDNNFAG